MIFVLAILVSGVVNIQTANSADIQKGGTLTMIAIFQPRGSIGIPWDFGMACSNVFYPCADLLVTQDYTGKIYPKLAESWDIDTKAPSITFHLRQDVKFHDGTPFNAEAAKYNLEQIMKKGYNPTPNWKAVVVVDDYTFRIDLKAYDSTIMTNLAQPRFFMFISPTAVEKNGLEWARYNPVSTGPFMLESYKEGVGAKYIKNPNYWQQGKPYVDAFNLQFVPDPATAYMALRAGKADILMNPGNTDQKIEAQKEGYVIPSFKYGGDAIELWPDSNNPDSYLANQKVRDAVEYAINKEELCKTLGYGLWSPAYQMTIKGAMGYNSSLESQHRKYNPDKAKQLFAESGYSGPITIATERRNKDIAVAIQGYLTAINIKCIVEDMDDAKYTDYANKGWHNKYILQGSPPNPDKLAGLSQTYRSDISRYQSIKKSDAFNQALMGALAASDQDTKMSLCEKAITIFFQENIGTPICTAGAPFIMSNKVNDLRPTDSHFGAYSYADAWLSK